MLNSTMTVNGDVLQQLKERIDRELEKPNLKSQDRINYEIQQLFVIILMNDHPKVETMWQTYKPAVWVGAIALTTIIALFVSGKMTVIISP